MIANARLVAFVASTDLDRSAHFYVDVLGCQLRDRNPFSILVDGGGAQLRITKVESFTAQAHTVLGWDVDDLDATVDSLRARGVEFRRYDGMAQDEHDSWRAPSGTRIAWFGDPDANTLSVQQHG